MEITQTLLFFLLFLFIAVIVKPLADRLHLPYPALLVSIGFIASEWLVSEGLDIGLRWDSFHDIVFYILLPILVYQAALRLNAEHFFNNILVILLLSVPFMLIATVITAILLFYGIDHAAGYPFIAALITATILSAIDPSAVLTLLKHMNIPKNVRSILEGEGLFSGAMAIVLTSLLVKGIIVAGQSITLTEGVLEFSRVFSGGLLVGIVVGLFAWILIRFIHDPILRGILSLVSAYSGFLIAESYLHVSGVIAVLIAGLMLNAFTQKADTQTREFLYALWDYKTTIATALLFILLGISIQYTVLLDQWLAIFIGVGASLMARVAITYIGLPLFGFASSIKKLHYCDRFVLFWGGLRGAVSIALVFSLPSSLPYYETIQGIVYGVVLFNLFIQAPTLKIICHWANKDSKGVIK